MAKKLKKVKNCKNRCGRVLLNKKTQMRYLTFTSYNLSSSLAHLFEKSGIETELVELLGSWGEIPVTYAGGVGSFADLEQLKVLGRNRVNVTIGSALDLFGGEMKYEEVLRYIGE